MSEKSCYNKSNVQLYNFWLCGWVGKVLYEKKLFSGIKEWNLLLFIHTLDNKNKTWQKPENIIGLIPQPLRVKFLTANCKITSILFDLEVTQFHSNNYQAHLTKAFIYIYIWFFAIEYNTPEQIFVEKCVEKEDEKLKGHPVSSIYLPVTCDSNMTNNFAKMRSKW